MELTRGGSGLHLRRYTPARVDLACAGRSLATGEVLDFQLAHARARDAVHALLDAELFAQSLREELPGSPEVLVLRTLAADRAVYLQRPDLGRRLHPESAALLHGDGCDVAVVIADGLSAVAVERSVVPLLQSLLPRLEGWVIGPVAVVSQGRVAVGDEVGALLRARLSLVLIGERPGLSSPASLGAYITWGPGADRTDADRNCVSNICADGLSAEMGAEKIFWYLENARLRGMSGVGLKDGTRVLL